MLRKGTRKRNDVKENIFHKLISLWIFFVLSQSAREISPNLLPDTKIFYKAYRALPKTNYEVVFDHTSTDTVSKLQIYL